ncbi:MAG: hypothetical protein PHQ64_03510, partial [Bacilli bacterium]|nr:hypothetical protein [Bacilli bacterium]
NGALSSTLNAGQSFTIPAGYTTGGTISANSLSSQTTATATAAQILSGQTAFVNGIKLTGTMANNGALSSALNAGGSFTIPAGYTTGGTISANSLSSQTTATATAAQILSGQTAFVNGTKLTGSMANNGTISATISAGGTYTLPEGYISGGTVTAGNASSQLITKQRTVLVNMTTVAVASVTFDFPEKIVGITSVSSSNANIRMANTSISGTNGASALLYCDQTQSTTMTFNAIGY